MLRFLPQVLRPLAIAAALLPCGACTPADHRAEKVVAYVNNDDARGIRLLRMLTADLEAEDSPAYRIRIVHVAADMSDAAQIRARLAPVIGSKPAAIVATNGESAIVAKSLTHDIPIVFGSQDDPTRLGLVVSLGRPGGNATGFTYYVPIDQKRLELLREIAAPSMTRVGVLADRWWLEQSGGEAVVKDAAMRGMQLRVFRAETLAEFADALRTPDARAVDAWYIPVSLLPFEHTDEVVALLGATRKPVIYPTTTFVERGGLLSYQQLLSMEEASRLIAKGVRLVLDGVSPGDIPVERPKSFELAINVQTARTLGLRIEPAYLKRADRVVDKRAAAP